MGPSLVSPPNLKLTLPLLKTLPALLSPVVEGHPARAPALP